MKKRRCALCRKTFKLNRRDKKYCSEKCYNRSWRAKNITKTQATIKAWRAKNITKIRAKAKAWRAKNKTQILEKHKVWYRKKNPIIKKKCKLCKKVFEPKRCDATKFCSIKCSRHGTTCIDPSPPIGKRFGSRVVIAAVRSKGRAFRWRIKCDCGNIYVALACIVKKTQRCNVCNQAALTLITVPIGKKLGYREVIATKIVRKHHNNPQTHFLLMRCVCGKETWVEKHEARVRKACHFCALVLATAKRWYPSLTDTELLRILELTIIRDLIPKLGGLYAQTKTKP